MAVVYYVTWMDPVTGFLKRLEFDTHEAAMGYVEDLKKKGIHVMYGHFER